MLKHTAGEEEQKKNLLSRMPTTAPTFHFERSQLNAVAELNTVIVNVESKK